jgi:ribosome-associated translation inhibitor RaiA
MNVDIRCLPRMTTDALSDHARRRVHFVMTRHTDRIQRIVVRLGEMTGTRGKQGKYCRIHVDLIDAQPVLNHETGADLYEVIDRTIDRAGRAVVQHLDKPRRSSLHERAAANAPVLRPLGRLQGRLS